MSQGLHCPRFATRERPCRGFSAEERSAYMLKKRAEAAIEQE